jgi:hypothetical protein
MYPCGGVQSGAWYGGAWYPYGYNMYGWPAAPWPPVVYYPVYWQPPGTPAKMPTILPQELLVKGTGADEEVEDTAWVGGDFDASLTLEYMPVEGATEPFITVDMSQGDSPHWEENPVAEGYHVKKDLPAVQPGTEIKITVRQTLARLRWCELLEREQGEEDL